MCKSQFYEKASEKCDLRLNKSIEIEFVQAFECECFFVKIILNVTVAQINAYGEHTYTARAKNKSGSTRKKLKEEERGKRYKGEAHKEKMEF